MCAMIATYDYPVTFFYVIFFSILFFHTVIYNANFDFLFKFRFYFKDIYGSILRIDQLYAICW